MTLGLWVVLAAIVPAYAGEDKDYCFGVQGTDREQPAPAMANGRIIGHDKAFFQNDVGAGGHCPGPSPACRLPGQSYVIPGDHVVLFNQKPGFVCAGFYVPRKFQLIIGWLPMEQVEVVPPQTMPVPRKFWEGTWRTSDADAEITLRWEGDTLRITGQAVWEGDDVPHTGELDDTGVPVGNTVDYGVKDRDTYDCSVRLITYGDHIILSDNSGCGGMNVRFSGFYTRMPPDKAAH